MTSKSSLPTVGTMAQPEFISHREDREIASLEDIFRSALPGNTADLGPEMAARSARHILSNAFVSTEDGTMIPIPPGIVRGTEHLLRHASSLGSQGDVVRVMGQSFIQGAANETELRANYSYLIEMEGGDLPILSQGVPAEEVTDEVRMVYYLTVRTDHDVPVNLSDREAYLLLRMRGFSSANVGSFNARERKKFLELLNAYCEAQERGETLSLPATTIGVSFSLLLKQVEAIRKLLKQGRGREINDALLRITQTGKTKQRQGYLAAADRLRRNYERGSRVDSVAKEALAEGYLETIKAVVTSYQGWLMEAFDLPKEEVAPPLTDDQLVKECAPAKASGPRRRKKTKKGKKGKIKKKKKNIKPANSASKAVAALAVRVIPFAEVILACFREIRAHTIHPRVYQRWILARPGEPYRDYSIANWREEVLSHYFTAGSDCLLANPKVSDKFFVSQKQADKTNYCAFAVIVDEKGNRIREGMLRIGIVGDGTEDAIVIHRHVQKIREQHIREDIRKHMGDFTPPKADEDWTPVPYKLQGENVDPEVQGNALILKYKKHPGFDIGGSLIITSLTEALKSRLTELIS